MITTKAIACSKCNNTGYYIDGDVMRECECVTQRQLLHLYKQTGIPIKYENVYLKDLTAKEYLEQGSKDLFNATMKNAKTYVEKADTMKECGMGLYIYSHNTGTGKTNIVCALANELFEKGYTYIRYMNFANLIQKVKQSWEEDNESKLINELCCTDFLIIDDFGSINTKDYINDRVYTIINYRYENQKPTFITANYGIKELDYDKRISSRLQENTVQLHFAEEDVRERVKQKIFEYMKEREK